MNYTQTTLEKVDITQISPLDQVRFIKAIRDNPMYLATLNAALDHIKSLKTTTQESRGFDGAIERSNTLLQEQSILFMDDLLGRYGNEAQQQINEQNK